MNKRHSAHTFSTLALALGACLYSSSPLSESNELIDAKVIGSQYAGNQNVLVRWATYNWDDNTYYDRRGPWVISSDGERTLRHYSLFARELDGDYFLVKDLGQTTDRTWSGNIPELNEYNTLQLQVREKDADTGEYSSGLQAPGQVIDLSDIDLPPSIDHQGDLLNIEFDRDESSFYTVTEIEEWASNYSDGGDETQEIFIDKVYGLNSSISAHLSFYNLGNLNLSYRQESTPADGFAVFQPCDVSRYIWGLGWLGACGDEIPVILKSETLAEHSNLPSFTMSSTVSVGEDYTLQEIPNWASNLYAGDNATKDSILQFHTIWVTNSELFEIGPWISLPSRTLHFKFKEGASGTSKMYVALADWAPNSPENIIYGDTIQNIYSQDIAADHSSIQTIEFSVGSNIQTQSTSNGAKGADMQGIPSTDTELSTTGGGGAAGLALLSLGLLTFSRRK